MCVKMINAYFARLDNQLLSVLHLAVWPAKLFVVPLVSHATYSVWFEVTRIECT